MPTKTKKSNVKVDPFTFTIGLTEIEIINIEACANFFRSFCELLYAAVGDGNNEVNVEALHSMIEPMVIRLSGHTDKLRERFNAEFEAHAKAAKAGAA